MTANPIKKRTTQVDVARHANVSQATVSYVLNDNMTISIPDHTRRRIIEAMDELGYVPNRAARTLRTQRTNMVACVVPDITNPFHTTFAKALQSVAEHHRYDMVLYNTDRLASKERMFMRILQEGRVDGVVLTPHHVEATDLSGILASGVPIVVQGTDVMPTEVDGAPLDSLYVDDVAASREAVSFLIGRGHVRIGMLSGQQFTPPQRLREVGYVQALEAHGLPFDPALVRGGDFREEGGYRGMQDLLEQPDPPTAVFSASDLMAVGAVLAARDAGLAIPDDIAIVGFDDIPLARLIHPSLTTISQFEDRIGVRAAEMLFDRLLSDDDIPGRRELMPFELIIRDSTGP